MCNAQFSLYSLQESDKSYTRETYDMPCNDAVAFLKMLGSNYFAEGYYGVKGYPSHKVMYQLKNDGSEYRSSSSEIPGKAAAKIEYFRKCRELPRTERGVEPPQ